MPILKPPKGALLQRGHPLARGLVGAWLMNEVRGTIVNDLSGNGNTGTLLANTTWRAELFGPALLMDGTDDCTSHSTTLPSFEYNTPFSVVIRVKRVGLASVQFIVGKQLNSGTYRGWMLRFQADNTVRFSLCDTDPTSIQVRTTGTYTSTTQWYMLAATY